MENHYMSIIWHIVASKQNQNLTVEQQQCKIVEILSLMKKDVEAFAKSEFKKKCIKSVQDSLNSL